MFLPRLCIVAFVFLQFAKFDVCESKSERRILPNTRASRVPAKSSRLQTRIGNPLGRNVQCPGNRKKCQLQLNFKIKRLDKQKRKCCKRKDKQCKKRFRKRCKNNTCLIRQGRKCRKQLLKCKNRKSTNNRPMNCDRKDRRSKNNHNRVTSPTPPTATTPVVLKREKERCLKSEDCEVGLCCARHQRVRICKPYILEGQVCTRGYRKRSPHMFERCPCAGGLTCAASESRHHTCQAVMLT